jgi:hypothetical protein
VKGKIIQIFEVMNLHTTKVDINLLWFGYVLSEFSEVHVLEAWWSVWLCVM